MRNAVTLKSVALSLDVAGLLAGPFNRTSILHNKILQLYCCQVTFELFFTPPNPLSQKIPVSDQPPGKLSLTEAIIAHLLRESAPAPLFGLELVRRSAAGELRLKKGTIYVTLERMEKKGLVTSELETSPPPDLKEGDFYIPRRMYRLTPKGLQGLAALEEAVARIPGFLVKS